MGKKLTRFAIGFWLVATAGLNGSAFAQTTAEIPSPNIEKAGRLREDIREMISLARDRVFPALVNIRVITVRYWDGKEEKGQAVGSGTIISAEGHLLTNYHVVQNGKKFRCTLADKQEITAELVGEDPLTDLAVLKLNLSELKDPNQRLPHAVFGNSDELCIGDTVMAMGSPWALSRSVTLGIVSNTERVLAATEDEAGEMYFDRDQRTGIFNRWIQHDAAINPGNSGGPLVNLKGELIGVNARGTFFGGDMGFAIPSNIGASVAKSLIEHKEVPRSSFGMSLKSIKKSGFKEGVLVNSLDKDGPAERARIHAGDVITSIDGQAVTVWFPEEVPALLKTLADYPIGSKVKFSLRRGTESLELQVVTEKLQKDKGKEAAFRAWGMVAVEITEKMARERRLDSTEGVLVDSVRSGSPAELAEPPLVEGDVVRIIDGKPVKTLPDLIALYDQIMAAEKLPEYLLVEFDRRGKNQLTLLKPKPDKDVDPPREVAKSWIGVAVQPVISKLARQMGRDEAIGFRITRVYPKTIAATSDFQVGDIILSLNGERLKPRGMQDAGLFHRQVRDLSTDGSAKVTVLREGVEKELTVQLEPTKMTQEEARRDKNRDFEITVREVTFFDRDENRWADDIQGVLTERVESAGWAMLGGIYPGDLIQRVGDAEITGLQSYRKAIDEITKKRPERVVFVVLRGVRTHYQYVEPDWFPSTQEAAKGPDEKEK